MTKTAGAEGGNSCHKNNKIAIRRVKGCPNKINKKTVPKFETADLFLRFFAGQRKLENGRNNHR
jgi:hypothetical protein